MDFFLFFPEPDLDVWPLRSFKVTKGHLEISKSSFLRYIFCLTAFFLKLFKNVNIMKKQIFDKMKYDLEGHPRSFNTTKIIIAHSFMDRFLWKFVWMLISWRHNFFTNYIMWLLCYWEVLWCFTLKPSDRNISLTYVLIDNLSPCFTSCSNNKESKLAWM